MDIGLGTEFLGRVQYNDVYKLDEVKSRGVGNGTVLCNENPIYVFLFWELLGLSPNFHIHVYVSDLYIPRMGPHISCSRRIDCGNI
jgi:hypothetical protein